MFLFMQKIKKNSAICIGISTFLSLACANALAAPTFDITDPRVATPFAHYIANLPPEEKKYLFYNIQFVCKDAPKILTSSKNAAQKELSKLLIKVASDDVQKWKKVKTLTDFLEENSLPYHFFKEQLTPYQEKIEQNLRQRLFMATSSHNDRKAERLLNINSVTRLEELECLLHVAAEKGNLQLLKKVLHKCYVCQKENPDFWRNICLWLLQRHTPDGSNRYFVNVANCYKKRPLHAAAENGHLEIVQFLLDTGAKCNVTSKHKDLTPLYLAVTSGHTPIVQCLLEHGANCNQGDSGLPLLFSIAIQKKFYDIAELLLDCGADVNTLAPYTNSVTVPPEFGSIIGIAPLHIAAKNNDTTTVEWLLNQGANIDITDDSQITPLHNAIRYGHREVVEILCNKGANIECCDKWQRTPLFDAVKFKRTAITHFLLARGADVNVTDSDEGNTPLHYAVRYGETDIVQALLKKNADVNGVNHNHKTPLYYAVVKGSFEKIQLLLNAGAEVDPNDAALRMALHQAYWQGHKKLVTFFTSNYAVTL